jgi:catalase
MKTTKHVLSAQEMSRAPEGHTAPGRRAEAPQKQGAPAEIHQHAGGSHPNMTTNQGIVIGDDQNSLRAGPRGPALLEDFILREKIFHFDHERIPERVVHARGYGAHGYFELTHSLAEYSRAAIFQEKGERTPVFVRFSTVAGNKGSADLARDVRGFAVKFYTKEGNWDLVGNNIPVFFIQDAIKFPDLIHAAKQEPDRGFPQAATAHDTFWDYISLTPEAMHMVMWIMSDRAIPRSLRMMEGFGIHTFRLVNEAGQSHFVKFHWRPKLGSQSVVWDEALKINGADPDFHRRDMWEAIQAGDFPEWELAVQIFDQAFADSFDFDVLDATKVIPEELVPLQPVGRMVLDRVVDNFFAETEQVAFCTANVVPGIDFSDDPLLQGRNFSYLDTQLKRLGGPNFHQIPVNRPRCPMANFQRDGHMQMDVPKGRVNYEPNSLSVDGPRENPSAGYQSFAEPIEGPKARHRSETFADHFSQARQFFDSQTVPEQNHIISALVFELSKVETPQVRQAVVAQLANIGGDIAKRVAGGLAMDGAIKPAKAARPTRTDLPPSPALSILAKAKPTLKGRKVGVLIADGTDVSEVKAIIKAVTKEGGVVAIVAPRVGGAAGADGKHIAADFQLAGGPSVLFDAVAIVADEKGADMLAKEAAAVAFVHDAFQHLKVIGHSKAAGKLLTKAGVMPDQGIVDVADVAAFTKAASGGRIWDREPKVRTVY